MFECQHQFNVYSLRLVSAFCAFLNGNVFSCGSRALFMRPTSTIFNNFFFKPGSHGIIYTFKNYFIIVFLVFNFQFSAISSIQTDP